MKIYSPYSKKQQDGRCFFEMPFYPKFIQKNSEIIKKAGIWKPNVEVMSQCEKIFVNLISHRKK